MTTSAVSFSSGCRSAQRTRFAAGLSTFVRSIRRISSCRSTWRSSSSSCAKTPSRASDFLEVGFGQAVKRQTKDALAKLMNCVAGNIADFDVHPENNDYPDEETERAIEFLADSRPSPETMLIESEAPDIAREKLLKAWDAVDDDDPLCLDVWIAHHCDGIPIKSNDPEREDLATRFNATPRQVKYWLEKGRETMRGALEEEE